MAWKAVRCAVVAGMLTAWAVPCLGQQQHATPVTVHWLDSVPAAADGVQWGVPWPEGAVHKADPLMLRGADGQAVAMQSWPLAYWPDGSIKWSGCAVGVAPAAGGNAEALKGPFTVSVGSGPAVAQPITVKEDGSGVEVDSGELHCRFVPGGSAVMQSLAIGDRTVAENGELVVQLEDRSQQGQGILRTVGFTSRVTKVTVEQSGPVRAVIKVEGMESEDAAAVATNVDKPGRTFLPFVMRFYFYAGTDAVRMVHSFIFDGDQEKDFIQGMGLRFGVPLKEELHNRHVRFVGEGTGVWRQPVRLLPGYRNALSPEQYEAHLAGKRMPNMAQLPNQTAMESVAVYNDFKLSQPNPNGYSIDKRTQDKSSWLHVTDGKRSLGMAVLGDVSGGIAVGVKDFWQKYPAALEINKATTAEGTLTVWLWSPDGPAMDMRTYDIEPHGLQTNYEDWKPGWGTASGVAHTTDMTLWAFSAIPSDTDLVAMAHEAAAPPELVCTPEYYHSIPVFGVWSLPDRSTPTLKWVEDQLDQLYTFYHDEVDERSWYGFWNFGDIMHNYDFGRHDWRYDIGGWAWANTELMPDMFLWYTFLRSGKADVFRMAEAMTRHTSETDVYHEGPFAPLGSRHNVNHWGDGAKQPRISHAMLKRYYYYLSGGDERVGDLMREQLDADLTYDKLQVYNGSHYVPTEEGPRLQGNTPAPSPAQLAAMPMPTEAPRRGPAAAAQTYSDGKPMEARYTNVAFNLEWICYSINWATEWERTGDPVWRDRVMAGMKSIVARSNGGPLGANYFDIIFGGPEILFDEKQMFDYPEFWDGFEKVCEAVATSSGNQMTAPRGAAYAAYIKKDQRLGSLAWDKLVGDAKIGPDTQIAPDVKITGPEVVHPVTDPNFLGKSAGWQLHGVASIQWALNALEVTELAKPFLPEWEKSRGISR
ncbi:MAG TPA: hypothetical protein VH253_16760 [Phycisphaerae bacterium]|nr:hypothetical protein [Phycisphaerae bacterium]